MQYEGEVSEEEEAAEDPKNYHDVPDIFRHVKDIPSVFTINSFGFTTSDTDVTNCECIVDKNEIRKNSKFTFDFFTIWVGDKFGMLVSNWNVTNMQTNFTNIIVT